MNSKQKWAIKKIYGSKKISDDVKEHLADIVYGWDIFMELKKKHPKEGLLRACYATFDIKFLGLYAIKTIEDIVNRAVTGDLLCGTGEGLRD